jgi:TonB-dependent SusC/RagA subfamily outer membrane receptor
MQKKLMIALLILMGMRVMAQNKWDRPVQLKSCTIQIEADLFTATSFLELEFFNPNDTEIEGLYNFQLQPGQAITAFQLDLNGKYRDGSIEEKWKATNAYNRVVGKRIDPALLTMNGLNSYSLRIYPVAGRNSRKVTMTIQQQLKPGAQTMDYLLPLSCKDPVENFHLSIDVRNSTQFPFIKEGLMNGSSFAGGYRHHTLNREQKNLVLDKPLSFHIPLGSETISCTKERDGQRYFALRTVPEKIAAYSIYPASVTIFWDVSASARNRDMNRELNFLRQYLAFYKPGEVRIKTFNYKLQDSAVFSSFRQVESFLRNQQFDGATALGCIDLSPVQSEAVLLFSDGYSSYGNDLPKPGKVYLYWIGSSSTNSSPLDDMVGESGGKKIDLQKSAVSDAVLDAGKANCMLMDIRSASGRTIINKEVYNKTFGQLVITGVMTQPHDSIRFIYGNTNREETIKAVYLDGRKSCQTSAIDRLETLQEFESVIQSGNWQKILLFGKTQKIVTPNTAYIVLERVEDYITYDIQPPKELEEECERRSYVKKDNTQLLKQLSERDILQGVISYYNARINSWNTGTPGNQMAEKETTITVLADQRPLSNGIANMKETETFAGNLDEVVVTGYGLRKQSMTGSVTSIRQEDILLGATSVEQALQGRVPGLQVTPAPVANNAIRIRGFSTLSDKQPLFILDGLPVSGDINSMISVADIDHIDVLKDISATAMYGSRAANGVILIESKKGKNNYRYYQGKYKLKNQEDVDYLAELKAVPLNQKLATYRELQVSYGDEPGFYFDVADHLYKSGFKKEGMQALSNAAEVSAGNISVLKAMAFVLEEWKEYDEAIRLFQQVKLLVNDPQSCRNLAWAWYKKGNYQKAADLLYEAVRTNYEQQEGTYQPVKAMILGELNAIISLHKAELDLSGINTSIVRPLPVDLRIVVDGNIPGVPWQVSITEPGGGMALPYQRSKNVAGTIQNQYGINEYQLRAAKKGMYAISVNYYDAYRQTLHVPIFVRITIFRNFGKSGQAIEMNNVVLDNQNGNIEIAEVKW